MLDHTDAALRRFLGPSLQTASLRAILLIGAFALIGSGCAYLLH